MKELKLKEDEVIQAGIETGFPIYNHIYYYGEKIWVNEVNRTISNIMRRHQL